jgi:hypothetical protein
MLDRIWGGCAASAAWWIRRNPTYLLSAACMAVGARLYLVEPRTRAGDVGMILLTLGVLQVYEWAVTAVLLFLHRRRRSPEDEPSLLLVTTLFWTGPLAATREMVANHPDLALILALGACAIAFAELRTVRRVMGLRISTAGQLLAGVCVVLLAIAPSLLKVPKAADGTNQIALYFAWWLLAIVAMACMATIRTCPPRPASGEVDASPIWRAFRIEIAFVTATLAATVAHLAAMNYAFFCNARWFYASPLIIAVAIMAMEYLARRRCPAWWSLAAVFALPGIAVFLADNRFDEHVPVRALPVFMRDPLFTTLALAGFAWWFGYRRLHRETFLHIGSAALAWAAYRGTLLFQPQLPPATHAITGGPIELSRNLVALLLYAVVAYLLLLAWWRRSRIDVLAALLVHQAAFTLVVHDRAEAYGLLILLAAGWNWLIGLHVAIRRPTLRLALWPICVLAAAAWFYDFNEAGQWIARTHAAAMVVVLAVAGLIWPWTRYRLVSAMIAASDIAFYSIKWIVSGRNGAASSVVLAGFILLAVGAVVGWHKARLLEMFQRPEENEPRGGQSPPYPAPPAG